MNNDQLYCDCPECVEAFTHRKRPEKFTEQQLNELASIYLHKHGLKCTNASPINVYEMGFYEAVEFFKQFLLEEPVDLLRSSYAIAKREGKSTNWKAWTIKLEKFFNKLNK